MRCNKCKRELITNRGVRYDDAVFSGGLCLNCYEKQYNTLTEQEKKPNFYKVINI